MNDNNNDNDKNIDKGSLGFNTLKRPKRPTTRNKKVFILILLYIVCEL